MNALGFAAGLGTACLWTFTAICFEEGSRRLGSFVLNVVRLLFALFFFVALSLIVSGHVVSPNAGREAWIYLSLSGIVGFVIGDLFLFRAFVLIGARLSMLIYSSVPPITAIIGFFFLGERMKPTSVAGMLVTVAGIAIAVVGRKPHEGGAVGTAATMAGRTAGILFAFGGSVGQAVGLILAKRGSLGHDSFEATEIRVIAGLSGFLILVFVLRRSGSLLHPFIAAFGTGNPAALAERRRMRGAIGITLAGAVLGPFLGVSLGLLSAQLLAIGIASTLMAIVPVLIIPVSAVAFREKVRISEAVGAVLTVAGVAALAL
jgi:drug/metabolite transporter (DMT)-like permease